jgi:hypothetical protein
MSEQDGQQAETARARRAWLAGLGVEVLVSRLIEAENEVAWLRRELEREAGERREQG